MRADMKARTADVAAKVEATREKAALTRAAQETMKQEIRVIFALIDLVKKQTILALIATLSSATLWSLVAYWHVFYWELIWDVTVNCVCVWLMLKSSKRSWRCCTKYGLCWPCYYRENKTDLVL